MTAKEKAKQILEKVVPHAKYWDCYWDEPLEEDHAEKIALIMVDEIIEECGWWEEGGEFSKYERERFDYWNEVKNEIKKL